MPIDSDLRNKYLQGALTPLHCWRTGTEIIEGTTQGDPLAMSLYAISLQPLITRLQVKSAASQCWYADDAAGCGSLEDVKTWWDKLMVSGPPLGYFPNPPKCWLIVKPENEQAAKEIFSETPINITTEGRKHPGAALGSRDFLEENVGEKVEEWVTQVARLAKFAKTPYIHHTSFSGAPRGAFQQPVYNKCKVP